MAGAHCTIFTSQRGKSNNIDAAALSDAEKEARAGVVRTNLKLALLNRLSQVHWRGKDERGRNGKNESGELHPEEKVFKSRLEEL